MKKVFNDVNLVAQLIVKQEQYEANEAYEDNDW